MLSVHAVDLDDDGDVDVLTGSSMEGKIAWYEQLSAQVAAGNANRDFQFDQLDIVAHFLSNHSFGIIPLMFVLGD